MVLQPLLQETQDFVLRGDVDAEGGVERGGPRVSGRPSSVEPTVARDAGAFGLRGFRAGRLRRRGARAGQAPETRVQGGRGLEATGSAAEISQRPRLHDGGHSAFGGAGAGATYDVTASAETAASVNTKPPPPPIGTICAARCRKRRLRGIARPQARTASLASSASGPVASSSCGGRPPALIPLSPAT